MSWGYVPKKLKQARRQQRLRKKYKGFSCETCKDGKYVWGSCSRLDWSRAFKGENGKWQMKDCKYWKPSAEAKLGTTSTNKEIVANPTEKKQPRRGVLSKLFK